MSPERVAAAGELRIQQHAFDQGYAVPVTPAPAAQQLSPQIPQQPITATPQAQQPQAPHTPQVQQPFSGFGAGFGMTQSQVGHPDSFKFSSWHDLLSMESPHLLDDATDDHVPLPKPTEVLEEHEEKRDPLDAAIRQLPISFNISRIKHMDLHVPQQTAPTAPLASLQDHEMTLESPPNDRGSGDFGSIFAQAAPAHVNLFAQNTLAPTPVTAPPLAFSATPVAASAPLAPMFAPSPLFSAPPTSSPAPSMFFSPPSTNSSAPPAAFSFIPATASALPANVSAPPLTFSVPPAKTPASITHTPDFSVAAPTAPTPTLPAPVAALASSLSAPAPSIVAPAPTMAVATTVAPGLLTRALPKFSLAALTPQKIPATFNEKQKHQFIMAFRLMSLDLGLRNHIINYPAISSDSECIRFHQEIKQMILDEAARVIPGTRKRISDDAGQQNGYISHKRQAINVSRESTSATAANPSALPASSGGKKRKADEQITKETYDVEGDDTSNESPRKGRTTTEERVSYPNLPSPKSPDAVKRASSTAQLFQNLANSQTTEESVRQKPVSSLSALQSKTGTMMGSNQKGPLSTFDPQPRSETLSKTPTPVFGSSTSSTSVNALSNTTSQSPFKVPNFAASKSQTSDKPSFQFSTPSSRSTDIPSFQFGASPSQAADKSPFRFATSSSKANDKPSFQIGTSSTKANNAPAAEASTSSTSSSKTAEKPSFQFSAPSSNGNDKPTGSVPKVGESASGASQKPAFKVPNFGAQSSSVKDAPASSVPKFGESASGASQKPGFQVPKFGNPTNFIDAFSKKAATDEKKEKAKRKAEEFDSEEDDEEEWERKDAEKQAAKKQKVAEFAKDEFKFKLPATTTTEPGKAPSPFSLSGSMTKSPTKSLGTEKAGDTPTTGRSLFDRIEKDTNGDPKRQMPPPEQKRSNLDFLAAPTNDAASKPITSSSTSTPSIDNIFSASASTSSSQGISSSSTTSSLAQNIFGDTSAPSKQNTPEKKRLGGFGTPNANPEAAKLFSGFSTSPNSGDNTWNPNTPIKFGTSQTAPAINITAATPTPATSSKQTSIFDSAVKPKPFAGFGQSTFGSTPTTSSTTSTLGSSVGFNFGAPPASTSNLTPSNNASAATSRGTTPDTGGTSDEEAAPDEQINLAIAAKGEETEESLFDGRARIQELDGETKKLETRGIGPLRLLKHKESGKCRLVGRIDSSGKVVLNAGLMPSIKYEKASEKQVRFGALNSQGKISTWVVRFKEATTAEEFAKACEESKNQ